MGSELPTTRDPARNVISREASHRPYILAAMCSAWRTHVHSRPELWTDIWVPMHSSTTREDGWRLGKVMWYLSKRLELCRTRCLRIHVFVEQWDDSHWIMQALARPELLSRYIGLEFSQKQVESLIPRGDIGAWRLLSKQLPALEYASIADDLAYDWQNDTMHNILPSCPNLRMYREVRRLPISTSDSPAQTMAPLVRHVQLFGSTSIRLRWILDACPNIETLYIDAPSRDATSSPDPLRSLSCPTLVNLVIGGSHGAAVPATMVHLFSDIEVPNIRHLDICYPEGDIKSTCTFFSQWIPHDNLASLTLRRVPYSLLPFFLPGYSAETVGEMPNLEVLHLEPEPTDTPRSTFYDFDSYLDDLPGLKQMHVTLPRQEGPRDLLQRGITLSKLRKTLNDRGVELVTE